MARNPRDFSDRAMRHEAEQRLKQHPLPAQSAVDTARLVHELEVHQIELELQNAELLRTRGELETMLERYVDLYDFSPVGYLTLNDHGMIVEANLMGAGLLAMDRSGLLHQPFESFLPEASRPAWREFLGTVSVGPGNQTFETLLARPGRAPIWVGMRVTPTAALQGRGWSCRVVFGDITDRREREEAQRQARSLAERNQELSDEVARRRAAERKLRASERNQRKSLAEALEMQAQLRQLSHQVLHTQEEERKRISRELHDGLTQTLVGINVHLAAAIKGAEHNPRGLQQRMARTQGLVKSAVEIVQAFARALRPTVLDHLGLEPALLSHLEEFRQRTAIDVQFTGIPEVEQVGIAERTVLFRVAQEALTNVARHAGARRLQVSLGLARGELVLRIQDDGVAFDVARVLRVSAGKHLGLLGMRERLEMVGGKLAIHSAPGKGTLIEARVPFVRKSPSAKTEEVVTESKSSPKRIRRQGSTRAARSGKRKAPQRRI
jgi:signal transduction histidine kinase